MARQWLGAAFLGLLFVTACSSNGGSALAGRSGDLGTLPGVRPASGSIGQYISHVVVIIQENRSFENFFAGYPGANAPLSGYGKDSSGKRFKIPLSVVTMEKSPNLPLS